MTGNTQFKNKFDTQGPIKKRSSFNDPINVYKCCGEVQGSKYESTWSTLNRGIDHDFSSVFEEDKPNKYSTNNTNMEEVGKLLKMLNQSEIMVKASNAVMKDLENQCNSRP